MTGLDRGRRHGCDDGGGTQVPALAGRCLRGGRGDRVVGRARGRIRLLDHAALNNAPTSGISRVNLDGSNPNPAFINAAGGVPGGVAVDAAHIYWTNADSHTIGRANLDGSGVDQNFITGVSFPSVGASLLAVDGGHIYWASLTVNPDNTANQTIGRANLDGSAPNASFITAPFGVNGVAVDAGHVYWTANRTDFNLITSGRIGRANLDGSSPNESFITLVGTAYGVAADGGHVYWTSLAANGTGTIGRATPMGAGSRSPSSRAPGTRSRSRWTAPRSTGPTTTSLASGPGSGARTWTGRLPTRPPSIPAPGAGRTGSRSTPSRRSLRRVLGRPGSRRRGSPVRSTSRS
jgi:hypothetical protein